MPKGGNSVWTYTQSGSNWIAQSVTVPVSMTNLTTSSNVQFSNVNWGDNAANDAVRKAAGSTAVAPPATVTTTPPAPVSDPAYISATSLIQPTNCNTNVYKLGGSQNVVLQHGIWSSSCAWTRMANWLNQDFLIGTEIVPSLSSNSTLTSQGNALVSEIESAGGFNYILAAHSQGGLVSRFAAQQLQALKPSPIKGVLTIDTPHNGANIAANLPAGFGGLLTGEGTNFWQSLGCSTPFDNIGCFEASLIFTVGVEVAPLIAVGVGHTSWTDLEPGSAFLNTLNGQQEKFTQAAIVGYTPQRFAFARIMTNFGDAIFCPAPGAPCCNPEDSCGERAISEYLQIFYDIVAAALIADELAILFYCTGDDGDGDGSGVGCQIPDALIDALPYFNGILSTLDSVDAWYNLFIDFPGDGNSDGIVQSQGQYYPSQYGSAVQYLIYGADSHTGALKSTYVHSALDAALATQFKVPTQAGGCGFFLLTSSASVPSSGGTGSFSVASGSGCQWSAASEAPWLSITAGPNGTASSGSVTYSVQPNPSTLSRMGTIQAGNGFSSTFFQVNQAGSCNYSLSGGPTVTVSGSGGSGTIQVTTGPDCVWSAIPGASWLTISAGASGTGPGSLTWKASQNTANLDRQATITVGGQATLIVIDGSPTGTPGEGVVSISGAPKTTTVYPCSGSSIVNCPPYTVPDNGTVSIIVQGVTFSTSYGSTSTAAILAQNLVNTINSTTGSPVSAILDPYGTAVILLSVANGASTNYSVSTSATFNTQYFSTPDFTASAPAHLTGGTN